ncbi:MAG: TonB-dependent receptor [Acidobacteriaceae bacterium]|nr:TonB-dependent receptor [Acidobacteriaceae bacterium]
MFDHSSTYTHHQLSLLAKGDYSLTDNVQIFGAYGYAHGIESYTGPGLSYLENEQGDATVYNLPDTSDMHTSVGRVGAHITAKTGPVRNEITVNGDYLQILAGYFYEYGDSYSTNIYHPIALTPLVPKVAGLKNIPNTNLNRLSSVAIADVATAFNGKLIVIGGVRGQWVGEKEYFSEIDRGSNNTPVGVACTENCSYNKGVASPSIAAMYHLPKGFSVYGNFMQDLQQGPTAPDGSANQSQVFAPYVAKQEEVGAKYEHGSLLATAALFQITEPNGVLNPTTNLYAVNGDQRNRGLELEVSGNIVPSIRVNGGISFIDARQRNTGVTFENDSNDTGGTDGKRAQGIPGTQSNLNVEWTVPKLRSLNLDARVVASNGQWGDTAEQLRIPAWARLDIGGRYQIKTKYPIDLRVNIDNVTGNNYYESGLLGLSLGAPRALRISSGIHF